MIELTLASYSDARIRSAAYIWNPKRARPAKVTQKAIKEYIGHGLNPEFIYRGMFPYQLPTGPIYEGQAISYHELRMAGIREILVRFNADRDVMRLSIWRNHE